VGNIRSTGSTVSSWDAVQPSYRKLIQEKERATAFRLECRRPLIFSIRGSSSTAAGYSETGTWAAETVPSYGGSERYATGQNIATWQVTGLASVLTKAIAKSGLAGSCRARKPYENARLCRQSL
jgi:hypothetical protein